MRGWFHLVFINELNVANFHKHAALRCAAMKMKVLLLHVASFESGFLVRLLWRSVIVYGNAARRIFSAYIMQIRLMIVNNWCRNQRRKGNWTETRTLNGKWTSNSLAKVNKRFIIWCNIRRLLAAASFSFIGALLFWAGTGVAPICKPFHFAFGEIEFGVFSIYTCNFDADR